MKMVGKHWCRQVIIILPLRYSVVKSSRYLRLCVTSSWRALLRYSVKNARRLWKSVQTPKVLINNMSVNMSDYFINTFFIKRKIIFLIDTENFNATFWVVLKILQVINSPKYVGITENYLCIHRVRKAPRWEQDSSPTRQFTDTVF